MSNLPAIRALCLYAKIRRCEFPPSAVGICLEGDTQLRLDTTVRLYRSGAIGHVIASGGVNDADHDNLDAHAMRAYLMKSGVPSSDISVEDRSQHTAHHPIYVAPILNAMHARDIVIITSGFHLLRAYLTFLKDKLANGRPYTIYCRPAGNWSHWLGTPRSEAHMRAILFFQELRKIRHYANDVLSIDDGMRYLDRR